jgi:hypothetical protein
MLATEYLEDCGIKVDTAGPAAEALNKLRLIRGGVDALVDDMDFQTAKGTFSCGRYVPSIQRCRS